MSDRGSQSEAAMTSPAPAKGKLAVAALRVLVMKETRELETRMIRIETDMEAKLNVMFGQEHPRWSQEHLYDYQWLRDWVGEKTLSEHLPEIAADFRKQLNAGASENDISGHGLSAPAVSATQPRAGKSRIFSFSFR